MLAIERQRKILESARKNGTVRTQELALNLKVTEETVRRDLDALSRQGLLRRTHGGAADVSMVFHEYSQNEREARQATEKEAIAKIGVKQIGEGETIMLDASSTALELARQLPEGLKLRVLTYSHEVIEKLAMRSDIELVLLGGSYEPKGRRFMGILTEMGARTYRIDRFFFSGDGYDVELGIGEPNPEESRLKATVINHAKWCCALMDHTKLGKDSDNFFVKPEQLDLLVADQLSEDFLKKLKQTGVRFLSADEK